MSISGTAAYRDRAALPETVLRAVELAERLGFEQSCRPEQGRLLRALAAGATARSARPVRGAGWAWAGCWRGGGRACGW
ncbi:hypothetical protein [Kitasatospora cheerisanensis]|uniref:hypothetical protein n=1 Tax=Kitasatospora cheerisanensis TaxID=81942 RepID=UPI001FCB8114|nr:hypothetical protein [Kitasatospora cheerisanensis]